VAVRVVFFDDGHGSWTLSYPSAQGRAVAVSVGKADTGRWQVAKANFTMAPTDGKGAEAFDFELREKNGKHNVIFSLMEIIVGDAEHYSNLNFSYFAQLFAPFTACAIVHTPL